MVEKSNTRKTSKTKKRNLYLKTEENHGRGVALSNLRRSSECSNYSNSIYLDKYDKISDSRCSNFSREKKQWDLNGRRVGADRSRSKANSIRSKGGEKSLNSTIGSHLLPKKRIISKKGKK